MDMDPLAEIIGTISDRARLVIDDICEEYEKEDRDRDTDVIAYGIHDLESEEHPWIPVSHLIVRLNDVRAISHFLCYLDDMDDILKNILFTVKSLCNAREDTYASAQNCALASCKLRVAIANYVKLNMCGRNGNTIQDNFMYRMSFHAASEENPITFEMYRALQRIVLYPRHAKEKGLAWDTPERERFVSEMAAIGWSAEARAFLSRVFVKVCGEIAFNTQGKEGEEDPFVLLLQSMSNYEIVNLVVDVASCDTASREDIDNVLV